MTFRLSDARCEEIKKIVVDTFISLSIRCVPISGFEMAQKLGIKVIPYSSKPESVRHLMMARSEDGFSVKYDGEWYIFYSDEQNYGRINNTLIHECGHIVLDHTEESTLAEAEANFFAKYAIAPPVLIHELNTSLMAATLETIAHTEITALETSSQKTILKPQKTFMIKLHMAVQSRLLIQTYE